MPNQRWLVKSEPFKYSWQKFEAEKRTTWDGVRNFEARNNLRAMRIGDPVLFYHSNEGKAVVGLAEVTREAFADPTAKDGDWSAVELAAKRPLRTPVSLEAIKKDPTLGEIGLLRKPRLSVIPLRPREFQRLLALGGSGK